MKRTTTSKDNVNVQATGAQDIANSAGLTERQRQELADLKKVHPANEFGGACGTPFMIFLLPVLVYWLWVSIEFNQGYLLLPTELSVNGVAQVITTLYDSVTTYARPTWRAASIYFSWFLFQVVLQVVVPGRVALGTPLPGGKRLPYTLNGWRCFWITMATVFGAVAGGYVDATLLYDNFGSILSVINIWALVFTCLLKIHAVLKDEEERMSGHFFYDFWMGFARNPRIGSFDLKLFCESRPGLALWALNNLSIAAKQYEQFGFIPLSTAMVCCFHFWYVADFHYNEEAILTTMDIVSEKFGYMLVYGDLAWVPFTYCLQCYYILKHVDSNGAPISISLGFAALVLAIKMFGWWLFRWANSQKHEFRRHPEAPIWGKRAEYISTKRGTKLLTSGFWGIARHLNYTGDIICAWAWCLPCLFDSPAPYFYGAYFTILELHRCHRDHLACVEKYGDDWKEYCRRVPYVFIPYLF
ncbi:hypothetical protein SAMD00019534_013130 [Acytostelium subglobosum LB1]|uniref:hypothetical protein n=1 Tax=Acytostelium subglobosum LB1 TaxID=1410327 RepID=UPI0006451F4B|nr:hypothetical protein SAMD00019534_013130 [Acytostelium subglobosum LB1]GAM18138.1 hypothetical protein SAMD00019534_013130 [Acytostelium subglobosum LB1]|eukprot:XP_012758734.1 hypothetical protein SAMD00019534_013130 [Acytostelium subglobosum LB1]